ncbi:unnamed protein product [[Candida] boidinii]|nr:unnamed protein product [[Candida] boidinii]
MMKKKPGSSTPSATTSKVPSAVGSPIVKPSAGLTGGSGTPPNAPLKTPTPGAVPPVVKGPPGSKAPAKAGGKKVDNSIDDILGLAATTTRKSKRGPRRGYVDVMGQNN